MSKRANVFAEDFQSIKRSADDAVFEFLKKGEATKQEAKDERSKVASSKDEQMIETEPATQEEKPERKDRLRTVRHKQGETKKHSPAAGPKEWGKPVALFNTRIPQEMSELLDDLVYRLKKNGKPHTKQAIAIEALDAYLRQQGIS